MSTVTFRGALGAAGAPMKAVDLFAGCGGLTLGLKRARFNVVGAVEIDERAANVYQANHPRVALKKTDIRRLSAKKFRLELGLQRGELDLLAGCPPCQGFSSLRTRNGAKRNRDSRNGLIDDMLRFVEEFLPRAVMMENVPGLARFKPFLGFCKRLEQLGYNVHFSIKDAAKYGVPQRRRRLILLAGRGFSVPFGKECSEVSNVRSAIGSLGAFAKSDTLHNLPERRSPKVMKLIRDIPRDGGSRGDLPANRQLACHRRSDGFKDIYGRMAWNEPAPTITSGCFNPSKGRFLHPVKNRAITMREAALLQSFPRNYVFDVSLGKQAIALMIGNALPPEFIRRHALEIGKAVKGLRRGR